MYISVKYEAGDGWSARSYTYECAIPDVMLGDIVSAPTSGNPAAKALVCGVNMPKPSFPCKVIADRWTEEKGNG